MIVLGIPTIRRLDTLQACVESAMHGKVKPDRIIIQDNSTNDFLRKDDPYWERFPVTIQSQGRNLGVAGSWNELVRRYGNLNHLILSNDDIEFYPETLDILMHAVYKHPYAAAVHHPHHPDGIGYALFYTTYKAWITVGGFDEQFYPAYYEDRDYDKLLQCYGLSTHVLPELPCRHVGSATLKSFDAEETREHYRNTARNEAYYQAKWGGIPGQERFDQPFYKPYSA